MLKKQPSLAANEFERFRKPTHLEKLLAELHTTVPRAELVALIDARYPKTMSAGGRSPAKLERMLQIHFLHLPMSVGRKSLACAAVPSRRGS